ncbi:MAG: hypothetical protein EZS28_004720 [Streblomastix strix]|uniref:Uncharacterized protein n=1 Tax=Streblomastix strix TaxID=222440 RepID=A0A5J4WZ14_9EUKA|nr:MAG: hypothetical protein EZS28_004720 [Streblomastix strix]
MLRANEDKSEFQKQQLLLPFDDYPVEKQRHFASAVILQLAKREENHDYIVEHNFLENLVPLLSDLNPRISSNAFCSLNNILFDDVDQKQLEDEGSQFDRKAPEFVYSICGLFNSFLPYLVSEIEQSYYPQVQSYLQSSSLYSLSYLPIPNPKVSSIGKNIIRYILSIIELISRSEDEFVIIGVIGEQIKGKDLNQLKLKGFEITENEQDKQKGDILIEILLNGIKAATIVRRIRTQIRKDDLKRQQEQIEHSDLDKIKKMIKTTSERNQQLAPTIPSSQQSSDKIDSQINNLPNLEDDDEDDYLILRKLKQKEIFELIREFLMGVGEQCVVCLHNIAITGSDAADNFDQLEKKKENGDIKNPNIFAQRFMRSESNAFNILSNYVQVGIEEMDVIRQKNERNGKQQQTNNNEKNKKKKLNKLKKMNDIEDILGDKDEDEQMDDDEEDDDIKDDDERSACIIGLMLRAQRIPNSLLITDQTSSFISESQSLSDQSITSKTSIPSLINILLNRINSDDGYAMRNCVQAILALSENKDNAMLIINRGFIPKLIFLLNNPSDAEIVVFSLKTLINILENIIDDVQKSNNKEKVKEDIGQQKLIYGDIDEEINDSDFPGNSRLHIPVANINLILKKLQAPYQPYELIELAKKAHDLVIKAGSAFQY